MSHLLGTEHASELRKATKKTESQLQFCNHAGDHLLEFSFQHASQKHLKISRKGYCKTFSSPPEKLISGILGIIWFALLIALVFSTRIVSPSQPCTHCPYGWISYSYNWYYIAEEKRSWSDSLVSCISKNCSLLYIDSEEEQAFLQFFSLASWTGFFRKSRSQPWVWENGSTFKPKITKVLHDDYNCIMISTSGLTADNCTTLHTYLCKCKFTNRNTCI